MAVHVWEELKHRTGTGRKVICTNCGLVARESHQGWECPGEEDQKPIANTTELAKRYAAIIDESASVIGCHPSELLTNVRCLVANYRNANAIVEPLNRLLDSNCYLKIWSLRSGTRIQFCGSWTGQYSNFNHSGKDLAECLKAALEAKVAAEKGAQG